MAHFSGPTFVENEAAYEKGKQARIQHNRRIGNQKRWVAESGQEIVDRCHAFLFEHGPFAHVPTIDRHGVEWLESHPVVKAVSGKFYGSLAKSILEFGRLTPAQEKAALDLIIKGEQRVAERLAAKQAKAACAKHVGQVGERQQFDLTIKFTTQYETRFGTTYVHIMEDAEGNVVVYKGSKVIGQKGDALSINAKIKEHTVRDGIAQTIISHPK